MSRVDDFESVFRSAIKERFRYAPPEVSSGLFLTDGEAAAADSEIAGLSALFSPAGAVKWSCAGRPELESVGDVIDHVARHPADVLACRRHIFGAGRGLDHSLGSLVDTLTQELDTPVLLLPDPPRSVPKATAQRVLVVTDHLTGDDILVNWGAALCDDAGTLYLAHIEDSATFDHYTDIVGKLPRLGGEDTAERIREKLLALPEEYIQSTTNALAEAGVGEKVIPVVKMGHAVADYRAIVTEHDVDLIVINTKDEKQIAMHGMAYALAVEIRDRPLLLL